MRRIETAPRGAGVRGYGYPGWRPPRPGFIMYVVALEYFTRFRHTPIMGNKVCQYAFRVIGALAVTGGKLGHVPICKNRVASGFRSKLNRSSGGTRFLQERRWLCISNTGG